MEDLAWSSDPLHDYRGVVCLYCILYLILHIDLVGIFINHVEDINLDCTDSAVKRK
jgi:hypothetical protein